MGAANGDDRDRDATGVGGGGEAEDEEEEDRACSSSVLEGTQYPAVGATSAMAAGVVLGEGGGGRCRGRVPGRGTRRSSQRRTRAAVVVVVVRGRHAATRDDPFPGTKGLLARAEGRGYDGDVRADGGVGRLADDNVSYETESGGSARGVGGSSRLRK